MKKKILITLLVITVLALGSFKGYQFYQENKLGNIIYNSIYLKYLGLAILMDNGKEGELIEASYNEAYLYKFSKTKEFEKRVMKVKTEAGKARLVNDIEEYTEYLDRKTERMIDGE